MKQSSDLKCKQASKNYGWLDYLPITASLTVYVLCLLLLWTLIEQVTIWNILLIALCPVGNALLVFFFAMEEVELAIWTRHHKQKGSANMALKQKAGSGSSPISCRPQLAPKSRKQR